MTTLIRPAPTAPALAHYPESDGQPMAENTRQFFWIVFIKENLATLFRDRDDVFVAGDLLWYPVEGRPDICRAPDTMVVFGRPKGERGSYRQWDEAGIAPQVVFEIWSPSNGFHDKLDRLHFYTQYGVQEYYAYDPEPAYNDLSGFQRVDNQLLPIPAMHGWVSPLLGIRFEPTPTTLELYRPDGRPFLSHQELEQQREQEHAARLQAEQQREQEHAARLQAEQRAARLAAKLRELGIDPSTINDV